MDELKQHLRQHRDQLDLSTPDQQVWERIRQGMSTPLIPLHKKIMPWLAAAVVAGVLFTGIYWWMQPHKPQQPTAKRQGPVQQPSKKQGQPDTVATVPARDAIAKNEPAPLPIKEKPVELRVPAVKKEAIHNRDKRDNSKADVLPGQMLDASYASIIHYQLHKIEKTPIHAESAEYFYDFKKQWNNLDREEMKLRRDIKIGGMNDQMVEEMIRIYQQKLSVLKQLQAEINKMNLRASKNPAIRRETPEFIKL